MCVTLLVRPYERIHRRQCQYSWQFKKNASQRRLGLHRPHGTTARLNNSSVNLLLWQLIVQLGIEPMGYARLEVLTTGSLKIHVVFDVTWCCPASRPYMCNVPIAVPTYSFWNTWFRGRRDNESSKCQCQ